MQTGNILLSSGKFGDCAAKNRRSPMEMVQTAAIFIIALVLELKRLCSMGFRMAT